MYQRKVVRRLKTARGAKPVAVYQSLGDDYPACNSVVGSMAAGGSCTLPDGSNIATWNGSQLKNPAGGSIDPANAAALVAGGWKPNQIAGASTSSSGSSIGSSIGAAASAIFGNLFGPKPSAPTVISSGPSTTELLLIGGGALAAIYFITKD